MAGELAPTPGPWISVLGHADVILVVGERDGAVVTIAAVNGSNAEPDAALICAAPEMAAAILAQDLVAARLALTSRGL